MAETQRIASAPLAPRPGPKPRPRHPARQSPPLSPALDPMPAKARVVATTTSAAAVYLSASSPRRTLPRRSPAEWVILAVLLLGLGLNVAALATSSHLSRSDLLLGATVLLAGLVLLILMELCRRLAPPPIDDGD